VLLISTAALSASNSVIFALIASLQDEYGFSDVGLGIIAATGFATSFLVQLLMSPLADRGYAKRLLLLGTVLSVVGNIVFATGASLPQFALGRALVGAAFGCFAPAARALIASMGTAHAAQRLGRISAAELAGFAIGPALGGILAGPLGLRWPFAVFAGAAVAAFFMVLTAHVPVLEGHAASQRLSFDLLRNRQVLVAVLLCLSLALPVGLYDALWGRFLGDLGAEEWLVGLSLTAYALPFVLLASRGGRLADRRGALPVARVGLAIGTVALVVLQLPGSAWGLAGVVIFAAGLLGVLWVPAGLLLTAGAELIDLDDAYAYAFFNLAWAAGFTVGAAGGGALAQVTTDAVPYLLLAGAYAVSLAVADRAPRYLVARGASSHR